MNKLIIGVVLATSISTVALAAPVGTVVASPPKVMAVTPAPAAPVNTQWTKWKTNLDMSFVTDTERNITQETSATEFGIVAGVRSFSFSLLPTYSWTDSEISNIEFIADYTLSVNDRMNIIPYGEINLDNNLDAGDKIIGIKTTYELN